MNPWRAELCVACKERFARVRGCCGRCYGRHAIKVKLGDTSWAELEHAGLARPPAGMENARRAIARALGTVYREQR